MVNEENLKDILLQQYAQCWEDKRNYDRMIWQTPAISLAIVAVIVAGLAGVRFAKSPIEILIALAFGLSITFVGTIQLAKHRFFSIAATRYMQGIQDSIRDVSNGILVNQDREIVPNIAFRTEDLRTSGFDLPTGWWYDRIAYNWLMWLMWAVMIGLSFSIVWVVFGLMRTCIW